MPGGLERGEAGAACALTPKGGGTREERSYPRLRPPSFLAAVRLEKGQDEASQERRLLDKESQQVTSLPVVQTLRPTEKGNNGSSCCF